MVNRAKQQQREAARAPPRDDAVADRYLLRFVLEAHTDRFRYLELDALRLAEERGADERRAVSI